MPNPVTPSKCSPAWAVLQRRQRSLPVAVLPLPSTFFLLFLRSLPASSSSLPSPSPQTPAWTPVWGQAPLHVAASVCAVQLEMTLFCLARVVRHGDFVLPPTCGDGVCSLAHPYFKESDYKCRGRTRECRALCVVKEREERGGTVPCQSHFLIRRM